MEKKPSNLSGCMVLLVIIAVIALIVVIIVSSAGSSGLGKAIFAILMSSVIVILLISVIFGAIDKQINLSRACAETSPAKVIAKTTEVKGRHTYTYYYISFEIQDGSRKNVKVDVDVYNKCLEGETGALTYKQFIDATDKENIHFINFERD